METAATLESIALALQKLQADVDLLAARQRERDELMGEVTPILREMMDGVTPTLQSMDERGYFSFARELGGVVDKVVSGYTAEDVRQLGDAAVAILDTVRAITQPEVLEVAGSAADVLQHPERAKPVGLYGMMKASKDDDVRRGFGVMVEVLRRIGKGAEAASGHKRSLESRLAPKRRALPPAPRTAAPRPAAPAPAPIAAAGCGVADAVLVEDWSREVAQQTATSLGYGPLTDAQWHLVQWCRDEYLSAGKSPNLRRITKGADVPTKTIYTLFPQKPGLTIAQIAGIPKPAGCI